MVASPPCPNIRVPWRRLSQNVWDIFVDSITNVDALEYVVRDRRRAWKTQRTRIERQIKDLKDELVRLDKKRRQYSWQQAEGIITAEDLVAAHRQLKSERAVIDEQMSRPEAFRREPAPPDRATFKAYAQYSAYDFRDELWHAPDNVKARFAELFDLHVTVRPGHGASEFCFDLSSNLPVDTLGNKPSAYDMAFSSSRGGRG